MQKKGIQKTLLFLAVTFLLSWPMAFGYLAAAGMSYSLSFLLMGTLYMFTPALAAIIVQKVVFKEKVLVPLGVSFRLNRWFLAALMLPPFLAVVATAVGLLFPGIRVTLDPATANIFEFFGRVFPEERVEALRRSVATLPIHPVLLTLLGGTIAGATVNAVAGFGEELGWRGLLQNELAPLGFWKSSWVIGYVWGLWHIPFIVYGHNYPGHPLAGIFMMTLWAILFAPLIGYMRLRADSVVAAAIMHGSLNGTAMAPALMTRGGDSLTVGVMGIAGISVLVVLNALLYRFGKTDFRHNQFLQQVQRHADQLYR